MSAELVDELHRVRRKVLVWTVNDPPTMRRMADLRIDGIISDDTKLMIQTLRE